MRSLKFMKIDYMKNRKQSKLIIFILVIGLLMSRGANDGYLMGFIYTVYIGSIFIYAVFADFSMHNVGFLLLLPGSTWHRVCGRFLYGIGSQAVLCTAYWLLIALFNGNLMLPVQSLSIYLVIMLIGIVMTDLQFTFLYLVGELKSQYAMNLLRILLPMCLFFIGFFVMKDIGESGEIGNRLMSAGIWVQGHMALSVAAAVGFVAALTYISIWISAAICSRRDYA